MPIQLYLSPGETQTSVSSESFPQRGSTSIFSSPSQSCLSWGWHNPFSFPIPAKHVRDGIRSVSSCQTAKERPISHTLARHHEAELLVAAGELTGLRGSDANENRYAQRAQTFGIQGFGVCDPSSVRVSLNEGPSHVVLLRWTSESHTS